MPSDLTPIETLSYEQAMSALEEIVSALEANQIALDEALALFERGQALAQHCAGLLEHAELRVRQLSQLGGAPDEDFSPEE